jgi:hypothetical protein
MSTSIEIKAKSKICALAHITAQWGFSVGTWSNPKWPLESQFKHVIFTHTTTIIELLLNRSGFVLQFLTLYLDNDAILRRQNDGHINDNINVFEEHRLVVFWVDLSKERQQLLTALLVQTRATIKQFVEDVDQLGIRETTALFGLSRWAT